MDVVARAIGCPDNSGRRDDFECISTSDTNRIYMPVSKLVPTEIQFWPTVDGEYITEDPLEILNAYYRSVIES